MEELEHISAQNIENMQKTITDSSPLSGMQFGYA